jgi:hypothetical protein
MVEGFCPVKAQRRGGIWRSDMRAGDAPAVACQNQILGSEINHQRKLITSLSHRQTVSVPRLKQRERSSQILGMFRRRDERNNAASAATRARCGSGYPFAEDSSGFDSLMNPIAGRMAAVHEASPVIRETLSVFVSLQGIPCIGSTNIACNLDLCADVNDTDNPN